MVIFICFFLVFGVIVKAELHAGLFHHAFDAVQRLGRRLAGQSSQTQLFGKGKALARLLVRFAEIRDVGIDRPHPDRIQFRFERVAVRIGKMLIDRHVGILRTELLPEEKLDHLGPAGLRLVDRFKDRHLAERIGANAGFEGLSVRRQREQGRSQNTIVSPHHTSPYTDHVYFPNKPLMAASVRSTSASPPSGPTRHDCGMAL
jgi:hypothetical protein